MSGSAAGSWDITRCETSNYAMPWPMQLAVEWFIGGSAQRVSSLCTVVLL